MYIAIAIIAFGILIGVHELGHFTAATLFNIKVNEFSLGMGPAIFKKQRGETLHTIRLFPIGGFCAMEGEDGTEEDTNHAQSAHSSGTSGSDSRSDDKTTDGSKRHA